MSSSKRDVELGSKERGTNKYTFLAASFALSFSFEISHYINITPAFKEKTKNKISYPRIHIYLYLVPKIGVE